MSYHIQSDKHWRVSKSGYSIKTGFAGNSRIVASYHAPHTPLNGPRFEQWLEDAQHACDLHNASIDGTTRADARIAELETAIKRQAAAVKMIDMSHVARAETMMQHAQVLHDQSNTAALESERAANALLTERIAELEQSVIVRDTEIARLETDLELARVAERERNSLRDFANAVMDSWPHGDVDGCDLERMAVDHGLLALKDPKPTEPCGDNCACSGYPTPEEWADGVDCYVRTPLLTGRTDNARAGNGGEG